MNAILFSMLLGFQQPVITAINDHILVTIDVGGEQQARKKNKKCKGCRYA